MITLTTKSKYRTLNIERWTPEAMLIHQHGRYSKLAIFPFTHVSKCMIDIRGFSEPCKMSCKSSLSRKGIPRYNLLLKQFQFDHVFLSALQLWRNSSLRVTRCRWFRKAILLRKMRRWLLAKLFRQVSLRQIEFRKSQP